MELHIEPRETFLHPEEEDEILIIYHPLRIAKIREGYIDVHMEGIGRIHRIPFTARQVLSKPIHYDCLWCWFVNIIACLSKVNECVKKVTQTSQTHPGYVCR